MFPIEEAAFYSEDAEFLPEYAVFSPDDAVHRPEKEGRCTLDEVWCLEYIWCGVCTLYTYPVLWILIPIDLIYSKIM